jgi:hypothetical protein
MDTMDRAPRRDVARRPAGRDDLTRLPGVGPSIAADLRSLGVRSIRGLARRNPERLYADLCRLTGERQDPCVLYTFRCAVYAAGTPGPDPELLKWWNWKDRRLAPPPRRRVRAAV